MLISLRRAAGNELEYLTLGTCTIGLPHVVILRVCVRLFFTKSATCVIYASKIRCHRIVYGVSSVLLTCGFR